MKPRQSVALTLKDRVLAQLVRWAASALLRLNRTQVLGAAYLEEALEGERPVVICHWHGRLLYAAWCLRRYRPVTIVSRSRDGEIMARILKRWGFTVIRGSRRQGGLEVLRRMEAALGDPRAVMVLTLDGSTGPARVAKGGGLSLAARKGAVLLPFTGAASRHWTFAQSWDRFQLPKPFGRLVFRFGPPIRCEEQAGVAVLAELAGVQITQLEEETDVLAAHKS